MPENEIIRLVHNEYEILVGDANGVDKAIQIILDDMKYPYVLVYHVGDKPRNNVGNWKEINVITKNKKGTFDYFSEKDIKMSDKCDFALVIWDNESRGALCNAIRVLSMGKKIRIYSGNEKKVFSIDSTDVFREIYGDDVVPSNLFSSSQVLELF